MAITRPTLDDVPGYLNELYKYVAILGKGSQLADPDADRILFWDDSAGTLTWLSLGTGLAISTTTLSPANDLAALEALGSTGLAARTGTDTWAQNYSTARTLDLSENDGYPVTTRLGVGRQISVKIENASAASMELEALELEYDELAT